MPDEADPPTTPEAECEPLDGEIRRRLFKLIHRELTGQRARALGDGVPAPLFDALLELRVERIHASTPLLDGHPSQEGKPPLTAVRSRP